MKKILYYDTWDLGYRNFLRLDPSFKKRGFETILLHTSSLTRKKVETEKDIHGIQAKDISFYKTLRLKKVIKKENPDVIIMLNLSFLIDRAIVSICKKLNIQVYYLAHGKLIPTENISGTKKIIQKNFKKNIFQKISKKNFYSVYNYFIENKSISFFFKLLKNPSLYTVFPKYSKELDVNGSFVYYPNEKPE